MKITITIESDCAHGNEPTIDLTDGEIIHTDQPELHGPVGHDSGQPHTEGDPDDEA